MLIKHDESPLPHKEPRVTLKPRLLAPSQASRPSNLAEPRYSSTAKLFLPVAFASYMARSARWIRVCASKFSTFSW